MVPRDTQCTVVQLAYQFPNWYIQDRGFCEFTRQKTSKIYLCAMFTKVILCSGNYSPTGKQDFAIGPTDRATVSNVRINHIQQAVY